MSELFVCDTEADGLLDEITKFHCFAFSNLDQSKWRIFCDYKSLPDQFKKEIDQRLSPQWRTLEEFKDWLHSGEMSGIIAHNILGYDLEAMKMLGYISNYDLGPDTIDDLPVRIYDTLAMSRCLSPDRQLPSGCPKKVHNSVTGKMDSIGPHGLAAWGYRVSNHKPVVNDWRDQPLDIYVNRVIEDVIINISVWKALSKEASDKAIGSKGWSEGLSLSQEAYHGMCVQERAGVPFDIDKAEALVIRIDDMMADIADSVEPQLPERVLPKSNQLVYPTSPFKDDGGLSSHGWNWLRKLGYELNEEAFNEIKVPKNPFKADGSASKVGEKFMEDNGLTTLDELREGVKKAREHNDIRPLEGDYLDKALVDIRSKRVPVLTAPMKLSNQDDIKKWLFSNAGWKPQYWRTKDVTHDTSKRERSNPEIMDKLKEYIEAAKTSPYQDEMYNQMGIKYKKLSPLELIDKLSRKARFLITSPQFKDERGELCPNLEKVHGEMAKNIVKWLSLRNRRSVLRASDEKKITGWLNNPRLKVDGRLPAGNSGLANTHRWKHRTVVNVPKSAPNVLLGKEFRELFYASKGNLFMGWDGAALEQRVACYYCWKYDDGWYFNQTMGEEDYHEKMATVYQQYAPQVNRSSGKNISYGLLYGAQSGKIASMLGISATAASALVDGFWDTNWSLKKLKDNLEAYWESTGKKYIRGVDGRKIFTRSKHSLLNALFQSTGAIFMDRAGKILRGKVRCLPEIDETTQRVLYQHDEYQYLIKRNMIEHKSFNTEEESNSFDDGKIWSNTHEIHGKFHRFYCKAGELATESIIEAGDYYNSPLPITASYDIGRNWSETH